MIRLYYPKKIENEITLDDQQKHYLFHVMRIKDGDAFQIFNEQYGEYRVVVNKNNIQLKEQTKQIKPLKTKALAFSLIKQNRLHWLVEKATELGVTHFFPILCERCQYNQFNIQRYLKIAIEASEQCGRLDIPIFQNTQKLSHFIINLSDSFSWYTCDPEGVSQQYIKNPYGMIIGPEGGFTRLEKQLLLQHTSMIKIHFNQLRSETAAIACLTFL